VISTIVLHLQNSQRTVTEKLNTVRSVAATMRDEPGAEDIAAAADFFEKNYRKEAELIYSVYKMARYDDSGIFHDVYAVAFDIYTEYLVIWNQTNWWDYPLGVPELNEPMRIRLDQANDPDSYLFSIGDLQVHNFYRGLKNDIYDQTAHMYRMVEGEDTGLLMKNRMQLINTFLSFVRATRPDLNKSDEILVALAQHYYDISSPILKTHLLDITFDPFVALFFATYMAKPEKDKHGVLYKLSVRELRSFTTAKGTLFGDVWVNFDPFILRLKRQRGAFISSSMPDAISQLVLFGKKFHQRAGLVFEDREKNITEEYLLPKDDACSQLIRDWNDAMVSKTPIPVTESFNVPLQEFTKEMIFGYLTEIFEREAGVIRANQVVFLQLADFHARINSKPNADQLWIVARSIRRLEETARDVIDDLLKGESVQDISPYLLKTYFQRADQTALMSRILNEILSGH
jgi:hypothetical protein